jgi:hypothetical protein
MKGRREKYIFSRVGTSGRGVGKRKGGMRVNTLDVFRIHI